MNPARRKKKSKKLADSQLSMDHHHQKHLELAGVVKGVHARLRKKYREYGDFDQIWDEHCKNKQLLNNYADAMHHLAVDHWNHRPETRIDWCKNTCHEYFLQDGLRKALAKDERRRKHEAGTGLSSSGSGECEEEAAEGAVEAGETMEERSREEGEEKSYLLSVLENPSILPNSPPGRCPHACHPSDTSSPLSIPRPSSGRHLEEETVLRKSDHHTAQKTARLEQLNEQFQPSEGARENPLDKCSDFVNRMSDGGGDGAQHDGGSDNDSGDNITEDEIERQKEVLYAKYDAAKYTTVTPPFQGRIRLLDVGSCFNPFLEYKEFLAVGIDISPAVESVLHCDFLHLETSKPLQLAPDTVDSILGSLQGPVTRLPCDAFHVVVFSLLLEYFPCTYQRWLCCQKAQKLLMVNGLLLIITPDSQHQQKNSAMVASWKQAIEAMGFKRWRYVKQQHLHCMAFRKLPPPTVDDSLSTNTLIGDTGPDMLFILQDFNSDPLCSEEPSDPFENLMRTDEEDFFVRDTFQELPDLIE